jgi:hypothetical protein
VEPTSFINIVSLTLNGDRDVPELINEDAFLCLRAEVNGLSVNYLKDGEVHNLVPSNPMNLFQQRRRVNFGHIELKKNRLGSQDNGHTCV